MTWMIREIQICNSHLIVTLGEVAARTSTGDIKTPSENLLFGDVREIRLDISFSIAHLGHVPSSSEKLQIKPFNYHIRIKQNYLYKTLV